MTRLSPSFGVTTPSRVLARFIQARRPIPINKEDIRHLVERDLVPGILRWAKRQTAQDRPIGNEREIAEGTLFVTVADGSTSKPVYVRVHAKATAKPYAAVLGGALGTAGRHTVIEVYLNGAMTPADIASEKRQQPLSSCTHETCLPYGLYNVLIHEVTHAAEVNLGDAEYDPSKAESEGYADYVNDPAEVRAFMQEVVDDAVRNAERKDLPFRTLAKRAPNPNQRFIELLLKLSTTWGQVSKEMTATNQRRILTAVYTALDERGLLVE